MVGHQGWGRKRKEEKRKAKRKGKVDSFRGRLTITDIAEWSSSLEIWLFQKEVDLRPMDVVDTTERDPEEEAHPRCST